MTPWSADVEAFLQHWKSLRRGALLPTSEYLLDHAPVVSMPRCYIAEVSADQTFIRYQGAAVTDFWQRDFTG